VSTPAAAPATTTNAPTLSVEATRLTGPAPLAVQFDASATTSPLSGVVPFHHITDSFNFGDNRGTTWANSGVSKNIQQGGPIASHVFDLPGTYTVSVRALGTNGAYSDATATVTVQDPATVYAGTNTVCVSTSSTFTGCPSGAAQQTSIPSPLTGKRVLLRRGETFASVNLRNTDNNFQIGAFGTGNKPTIGGLNAGMVGGVAQWVSDFTVMDLNIGSGTVNIDATTTRFLLYRNDVKTPGTTASMVNIGTAATYYQSYGSGSVPSQMPWPREVFLVENDIQGVVSSASRPNVVVMGFFYKSALLGNTIDKATEHSLRIWAAGKTQISHNTIGGNHYAPTLPGIRGAVKIHSGGTQAFTPLIAGSAKPATSQVVMSNNIIGSSTYPGSFLSGMGPQNADPSTVEGLEDCIAENNVYVRGPYTSSELQVRGKRMSSRGNTVQGGGAARVANIVANFNAAMNDWNGPYFFD
jgi:hypothetical protein